MCTPRFPVKCESDDADDHSERFFATLINNPQLSFNLHSQFV